MDEFCAMIGTQFQGSTMKGIVKVPLQTFNVGNPDITDGRELKVQNLFYISVA